MWYKRLFKPSKKVGEVGVEKDVVVPMAVIKLQAFVERVDVDRLVENPVLRRFLLTVHWSDIGQLFDAILRQRKETPVLTGVNIYTYFKTAGTPASICLKRLVDTLTQTPTSSYSVNRDIEQLILQLEEASAIESQLKETP